MTAVALFLRYIQDPAPSGLLDQQVAVIQRPAKRQFTSGKVGGQDALGAIQI